MNSLSNERLDQTIFWSPFQAGMFHDSMNDVLVLAYSQNHISTLQYQAFAVFVGFVLFHFLVPNIILSWSSQIDLN